jgi:hypothetical protein
MSNMTQIVPTTSQSIGFALDWRVFVRQPGSDFDVCGTMHWTGKLSRPVQKKGG